MKSISASLRLVFPPISNQESEWILEDKGTRNHLASSRIYMICQREEILFSDFSDEGEVLRFKLNGSHRSAEVNLQLEYLVKELAVKDDGCLHIEATPKYIRVWDERSDGKRVLIEWFTADKILFDVWRGSPAVEMSDDHRSFATYRLHYIGMSSSSAFKRLVEKPHHKRIKVLSNETQIRLTARLTDEIMLMFFEIDPIFIGQVASDDDIKDAVEILINPFAYLPMENIVKDAEKAFISMINTKYNTIKYQSFPEGSHLAEAGYARSIFTIAEDITLIAGDLQVDGGYKQGLPSSNAADYILLRDKSVTLVDISKREYQTIDDYL